MKTIDLRSDTTTRPTKQMREAMHAAEVGDDVYREDPTTNRLEALAAEMTGKEASLFVSSGSMGNLISLYIQGGRGCEVITESSSHIMLHEIGSAAAIAGVQLIGVPTKDGILTAEAVLPHLHPNDYTLSRVSMLEVENTKDGRCYPLEDLKGLRTIADEHGLLVHMDGARLFNAAIAQGVPVSQLCAFTDTVSFCLSKGLGAPVGSMLCGSRAFIDEALKVRKMLGGGMRQTGILAAAGIHALQHHLSRLEEDHRHARKIAEALSKTSWAELDPETIETNIIFFTVVGTDADTAVSHLAQKGVLCFSGPENTIRMVTHIDISAADTDRAVEIIKSLRPCSSEPA